MASAVPEPDTRGWQVGKSVTGCLQHMLDHEMACDVTFQIQFPGEPCDTVPAHKLMLTARSPVFEAMFSGAYRSGDVTICDIPLESFKALLRYIYTDDVTLTGDNVLHLLAAAKKYILEGLVNKCTEFLDKMITYKNVCSILTHSIFYQEDKLIQKYLDVIAPNAKAVSKTEAFYNMSYDALHKVLQYDPLSVDAEADLFEGCLEWGKRKVKEKRDQEVKVEKDGKEKAIDDEEIRSVLGDCLHQIRFPYISAQDFAKKSWGTSALTGDEKSTILCLGLAQEHERRPQLDWLSEHGFNIASRMLTAQRYSYAFGTSYNIPVTAGPAEEFTFSLNTTSSVKLMGFSVYGGTAGAEHDVKVTIHNQTTNTEISSTESKITSSGQGQPILVMTTKLIVEPKIQYKASVSITGKSPVGFLQYFTSTSSGGNNVSFVQNIIKYPNGSNGFVSHFLFQKF